MQNKSRNPDLKYAFNENMSLGVKILLAIQYMVPNMVSLMFPILAMQIVSVPASQAESVLSITMLIMALVTFLQSRRFKKLTAGMLLPPSVAPPYLAPSILAIKTGGLSLIFGMTMIAGVVQVGLSFVVRHIRRFIPVEIASLVLLLIGFELGGFSFHLYTNIHVPLLLGFKKVLFYAVVFIPLVLILIFDQFCGPHLKTYAIVCAVIIGYVFIWLFGFMDPQHIATIQHASWFFVPHLFVGQYRFSSDLIIPFIFSAVICVIKIIGSVSAMQEIQSKEVQPIDFNRLSRANFVDGLGTLLAGVFGTLGMNASSSGVALSLSKGVTSRFIAGPLAIMLILPAFMPKASLVLLYIPHAVMAAVLLDLGSALVKSSCVILLKSFNRLSVQLYVGIGLTVGLSYDIYPQIYQQLPQSLHMLIGSSVALAMLFAVVVFLFSSFFIRFVVGRGVE